MLELTSQQTVDTETLKEKQMEHSYWSDVAVLSYINS